jgi:HKD family nuclease
MNLLTSKLPPLKLNNQTFSDAFNDFLDRSSRMDIAVGYITADSLAWLHEALKTMSNIQSVNLVIGMHYWEKFTEREYKTAAEFDTYLRNENRGSLKLVKTFKYHGKLYSWSDNSGVISGIIGSDNLGGITAGTRSYEVSALFSEQNDAQKIKTFIDDLTLKTTVDVSQYEKDERGFRINTNLLEGHEGVLKVERAKTAEYSQNRTNISFAIPLKGVDVSRPRTNRDGGKSNLNCFFGKGRETPTGKILPRPWYEVELIPGNAITSLPNYPQPNTPFTVVTDDGWTFECQVQGGDDGRKNFRSSGDLQTLGMWIKGRMEDAGALDIGHLVTTNTISDFGKNVLILTKTNVDDKWFLEFGVK